jgi:hypothetical protein
MEGCSDVIGRHDAGFTEHAKKNHIKAGEKAF